MTDRHTPAPPAPTAPTLANLGLLAAAAAVVGWGIGNVMVRKVPMPGLQLAFWRFLLAAAVYTVVLYATGHRLHRRQLLRSAPTGAILGLQTGAFFVAVKSTTIANATMILALLPVVLLGVATRRFNEPISRLLVGMIAVALLGMGLVLFGSADEPTWSPRGDVIAATALLLMATNFALAKRARLFVPAFEFQTGLWIVGSVVLLPMALVDAGGFEPPSAEVWGWLLLLLAVPGSAHLFMNWAHNHVKLSTASMLTLATPVISTIGATLFLDERIVVVQVVGAGLVISALIAVIRREAQIADKT